MKQSYPLTWPAGYKRTESEKRIWSRFKQTMDKAQRFLRIEILRLGGRDLIVSTNLKVRTDGMIYASDLSKKIEDPGVAIYFQYKGKDVSMCCDQYTTVWENMFALGKGIEALRGMERWGVSEFLDRAFTGFKALPDSNNVPSVGWWQVLGLTPDATIDQVKEAYRRMAMRYHPDNAETGNSHMFMTIKAAYEQALKNL